MLRALKRKSRVFDRRHRKMHHKVALINLENRSSFEIESKFGESVCTACNHSVGKSRRCM